MAQVEGWLGKWFQRHEFVRNRHGITVVPTDEQWRRMGVLVFSVLDPVREYVGRPVRVTSGVRNDALNLAVGGSPTSQHKEGEAVDIKATDMTSAELVRAILASGVTFDQLIGYHPSHGGHVHISYTERRPNRGEVLWVPAGGKRYVPWKAADGILA